jgi:hypothetical protein
MGFSFPFLDRGGWFITRTVASIVVQDILVDELCHVVLVQFHPPRQVHYRDGCHGGEGIIWGIYFMHHQQSGCEMNESKRTLRRAMETPSHRKLPTLRRSASNSDLLDATWRDIQGEEPDRERS